METKKGTDRRAAMKKREEYVLASSITAFCLPFVYVIAFFFESAPYEPYDSIIFFASLMGGSFLGSIVGIISLLLHRSKRNKKIYILSLFPVFTLLISIIFDFISSYHMP